MRACNARHQEPSVWNDVQYTKLHIYNTLARRVAAGKLLGSVTKTAIAYWPLLLCSPFGHKIITLLSSEVTETSELGDHPGGESLHAACVATPAEDVVVQRVAAPAFRFGRK